MDELSILATYNRATNDEVNQILGRLSHEQLSRTIGGFFESVIRTANHILLADITWLRRLAGEMASLRSLESQIPDPGTFSFRAVPWPRLDQYLPVRTEVDVLLERVVETITPAERTATISYRRANGEPKESVVGHVLLHVFNHQTHHRGQIALMLDELGVENDYSNLIWKVRDLPRSPA